MSYQIIAEKPIGEVITDQGAYMQMKLMHIVCDTISQIPEPLPAWATGSRCDVTADGGAVYMLNNARNWEKVNFFGNAGGDSGTTDYSELTNKPQINGVTLSGNKTAADLNLETDLSDYYTKQQTDSKITEKVAEIVADAPEDFDTLKEMSDWIENHEESAAAMNTAIQQNTTAIAGKVDKVAGKGLSTNDFTTAEKTKLTGLENYDDSRIVADISALQTSVSGKVDAVSGMGLSQNSFTDAEKTKLEGIETGANKITVDSSLDSASSNPVQNQAVYTALNSKVDMVTGKQLSTEDYTTAEKTKLAGLPKSLIVYDNAIMAENKYVEVPSGSAVGTTITADLPFTLSPGDVIFINVGEGETDHIIPPFMLTYGSNAQVYVAVNSVDDFSVVGYIKIWFYGPSQFRVRVLKQATTSIVWVNVSRLKIK